MENMKLWTLENNTEEIEMDKPCDFCKIVFDAKINRNKRVQKYCSPKCRNRMNMLNSLNREKGK